MKIRDRIKAIIRERGVTICSIAPKAGITRANVSDYLNGRSDLRVASLERLLAALGLTLALTDAQDLPHDAPGGVPATHDTNGAS